VIEEMPKARIIPGHVLWQDIDNAILQGFDRLFGRSGTAADNLAKMQSDVEDILKR